MTRNPILSTDELAALRLAAVPAVSDQAPTQPRSAQLKAIYKQSGAIQDLMAWSLEVSKETHRLTRQLAAFQRRVNLN